MDLTKLAEPFPARDVEWRIAQSGTGRDGKVWAKVLAYITNRAIMDRLDDVCGPLGWRNEFKEWTVGGTAGVLCGLSIYTIEGEWVTKWDGAENTDIEAVKGGLSGAMKRAAVQWGIGRYLYDLEEGWATICEDNRDKQAHYAKTKEGTVFYWRPPPLPTWALPNGHQPPPNDSREANTLSPAQQDKARADNPQPPAEPRVSQADIDRISTIADALGLTTAQKNACMFYIPIKRITALKLRDVDKFILWMHREAVSKLLTELALSLADVCIEDPSVVADVPDELDLPQAQAALAVLKSCKERGAAV